MNTLCDIISHPNTPRYLQAIAIIIAAWLTYHFAVKKSHAETQRQIAMDYNTRRADALQQAWHLLAYLNPAENAQSIFTFTRQGKQDTWYLRPQQARQFLQHALPQAFYENHAGLYWPSELKEELFECRSSLYGLCLKTQSLHSHNTDPIQVTNIELINQTKKHYEKTRSMLKTQVPALYQQCM